MKNYQILNKDSECEYEISVSHDPNGTHYFLFASHNPIWRTNIQGQVLLKLTDNGNGITFGELCKQLDYDTMTYMRLLLNFANFSENDVPIKYNVIEIKESIITQI